MRRLSQTAAASPDGSGPKRLPPMVPLSRYAGRPIVLVEAELRPSADPKQGSWARLVVRLPGTQMLVTCKSDSRLVCGQVEHLSKEDFPLLAMLAVTPNGKGGNVHRLVDPDPEAARLAEALEAQPGEETTRELAVVLATSDEVKQALWREAKRAAPTAPLPEMHRALARDYWRRIEGMA